MPEETIPNKLERGPGFLQEAINAIRAYAIQSHIKQIMIPGVGTSTAVPADMLITPDGVFVTLKGVAPASSGLPPAPASGTYWLAAIDGVVSWQPTTTVCP